MRIIRTGTDSLSTYANRYTRNGYTILVTDYEKKKSQPQGCTNMLEVTIKQTTESAQECGL
jgi:hypothetical protein